ncbi:hypothetical protein A2765_05210 [Candidatus Kaiserbacteria bacterium RIFCSPHIGHO2_01_FULL_56_24]|uniref:Uncharacterized protein n=1 Tax=Candidatus Kaiserbacteria bacterium RIFCSPHIGHO2_01_FULL_56_24 TaxID=1798487 RepID=A0A1F6D9X2_9BACT|nr:MAG: hypothetical protein A2765_05210 [Candidatus Kaiserbacteria bacterium RIFCSPHIGHO2_01_FULL_56_24]
MPKFSRTRQLHCFKCDKPLQEAVPGTLQPSRGTDWQASGNYGSTVFDPSGSPQPELLVISICDDCLAENAERVHLFIGARLATIEETKKKFA